MGGREGKGGGLRGSGKRGGGGGGRWSGARGSGELGERWERVEKAGRQRGDDGKGLGRERGV